MSINDIVAGDPNKIPEHLLTEEEKKLLPGWKANHKAKMDKMKPAEPSPERKMQQAFEVFMMTEGVPPHTIVNGTAWTLHVAAVWRAFKAGAEYAKR
jgi:hypothetical protein